MKFFGVLFCVLDREGDREGNEALILIFIFTILLIKQLILLGIALLFYE